MTIYDVMQIRLRGSLAEAMMKVIEYSIGIGAMSEAVNQKQYTNAVNARLYEEGGGRGN